MLKASDENEPGAYMYADIQVTTPRSRGVGLSGREESKNHGDREKTWATAARAKLTPL